MRTVIPTTISRVLTFGTALALCAGSVVALAGQTPAPRPFPGSGPARPVDSPPAQAPAPEPQAPVANDRAPAPAAPAPSPSNGPTPNQPPAGLPVYPTAEFIAGYDAGQGQRYYLFGSDMPYDDIVAYYRSVLDTGGRELFREPPTRQFELGRFREDSMAYPPSVVVKDYAWNGGTGYLAVSGTNERRYRTVIQIVPPEPSN